MIVTIILVVGLIGIVVFITNNNANNNMESKTTAKDFFINLGAIVALGFFVANLIGLLFTIINRAYPPTVGYGYYGSGSISFPVAALIIFFPVYVLLMWLLEKGYRMEPEKRNVGIRKWLTYITLFVSGFALAGDLVTILYYFIDGRDITTGFILKVLVVLVISLSIFFYYIYDVMGKSSEKFRRTWMIASAIIILLCIIWGFSVLGSPRTQQLLKYDEQKVSDLQNIEGSVQSFYSLKGFLPKDLAELATNQNYYVNTTDPQTKKSYEYEKTSDTTYSLCAEFNKGLNQADYTARFGPYGGNTWLHGIGRFCFQEIINPNIYSKPGIVPVP